jgi:ESCRT-I complex subunit VPS37
LILRVNIPAASTMSLCPAMSLAGVRVQHNWVDARTMRVIGYDPIQSESQWRASKLLLSEAVHAVVKQFQLYPPHVLEITDRGLQAIQPNNKRASTTTMASHHGTKEAPPDYSIFQQQQQQQQTTSSSSSSYPEEPIPNVTMPEVPREFPEISAMSRDDLEELLTDEIEFLTLAHQLPIYEEIQQIGTGSVIEDNATMAKKNLEQEQVLQALRKEVATLQTELTQKVQHFETLEAKQNQLCAPPNKRDVLRKLNKAKKESFESSEALAEEWVENGDMPVDEFVKTFVAARRIHHERAAKIELLNRRR